MPRYKPNPDPLISRKPHKCQICRTQTIALQYADGSGMVANLCPKCDLPWPLAPQTMMAGRRQPRA